MDIAKLLGVVEQTKAVYDGQDEFYEYAEDEEIEIPALTPDELQPFMKRMMQAAGFNGDPPEIRLDITDEENLGGQFCQDRSDDKVYIRLHPRQLHTGIILHELAHCLRSNNGHGPQFFGVLLVLYRHGISRVAAQELAGQFQDHGVEVDRDWADGCGVDLDDDCRLIPPFDAP